MSLISRICLVISIILLNSIAYSDPIPPNLLQGQELIETTINKIASNIDTKQLSVNWIKNPDGSITATVQYKNNSMDIKLTPEEIKAASTGVLLPSVKEKIFKMTSLFELKDGALQ